MNIQLSKRVIQIKPSPTLTVTARAQEMRRQGKDVISLGAGEPDFDTPNHIKEAAIKAIQTGFTKYTPVDGIPSLKEAIINKFKTFNHLDYTPDEIIVSSGGKQCIYNTYQALLNEGDEIIIPAPYWVSYPDMALLAGAKPIIVPTTLSQNFKLTEKILEKAITPQTKIFMINSPSNPTGMAYTKSELEKLGVVLRKHPHVLIATDDMYEHILWNNKPFVNIVNACPDLKPRTIVLSGVSKAYSMTGWRIGYAAGPKTVIQAMKKIQGQSTSNPCSISQAAAEAALRGSLDTVETMVNAFKTRHDFVVEALNAIPGVQCAPADGAFYAFFNVDAIIKHHPSIQNDTQLAEHLIEHAGVALVPGSAFGAPGYLRLSIATSMENLQEALKRLQKAFSSTSS